MQLCIDPDFAFLNFSAHPDSLKSALGGKGYSKRASLQHVSYAESCPDSCLNMAQVQVSGFGSTVTALFLRVRVLQGKVKQKQNFM